MRLDLTERQKGERRTHARGCEYVSGRCGQGLGGCAGAHLDDLAALDLGRAPVAHRLLVLLDGRAVDHRARAHADVVVLNVGCAVVWM